MQQRPLFFLVLLVGALARTGGAASMDLTVDARLSFEPPQFAGTARVTWRHERASPVRMVRLLLFANRFRAEPVLDDLSRYALLAGGTYRPGGTRVVSVIGFDRKLAHQLEPAPDESAAAVLAIDLGRQVNAGQRLELVIGFETSVPNLLDVFGATDDLVIADGGWYPQPLALDAAKGLRPAWTRTVATLKAPEGSELLANGRRFSGSQTAEIAASAGEALSVVLCRPGFTERRIRMGSRVVSLYGVPPTEIHHRIAATPSAELALLEALPAVVAESENDRDLTLVRLPLRWAPTHATSAMIFLSDRLFDLHPLLRFTHRRELAYATFLLEELRRARAREPPGDAEWVAEALAWQRADRLYVEKFRPEREVRDWIGVFDVFAIVDRFETAPRVPLVRPFFPWMASDDPLRLRPASAFRERPPGRVLFAKLEARLGPERVREMLDRYVAGRRPLRQELEDVGGLDAVRFLEDWLRPYPEVNYSLERLPEEEDARARVRVRREGGLLPARDAIEVGLEGPEGRRNLFVRIDPPAVEVDVGTARAAERVTLDPRRRIVETRLDDNQKPPQYQYLLDSADVEVSSTEFGFSTLFVARERYDYRKDVAAAPFVTNRGYGVNAGIQLHGGAPIDANLYRRNLFAYFGVEELNADFDDRETPGLRTPGRVAGFGLRFNYFDAFWFENPTRSHHLRAFVDLYDRALGSDYDYVRGGASVAATRALRADTVLAAEILNGFLEPTAGGPAPLQGLYSLGGFRSIRGIGAEENLAENIVVARGEVRWLAPIRLDLNFQDLLVARRIQFRTFVDAGRVSDDVGGVYRLSDFAVGAGGGANLFYDFLGFFPTSVYVDVATRVDRRESVQVLFGARQPF